MMKNGGFVIETKGVTKVFKALDFWKTDRVQALDGADLAVQKGEIFGLLGLNGAGKTTLMKILLGLLKPTSGTVSVLGLKPGDGNALTQMGYLSELPYFPKYLKAREILDYFADLLGIPYSEKKKRISEVLELTGLSAKAGTKVKGFSKGMQGRLGLAQAILNKPGLLFLDEPMSGLDPLGYKETRDIILDLNKKGTTVFFNSHILSEVEKICDRVAIMHKGRISQPLSVKEILKKNKDLESYFVKMTAAGAKR